MPDDILKHLRPDEAKWLQGHASDRVEACSVAEMLHRLAREREDAKRLHDACLALAYPDGHIRGPVMDGPELHHLSNILMQLKTSESPTSSGT